MWCDGAYSSTIYHDLLRALLILASLFICRPSVRILATSTLLSTLGVALPGFAVTTLGVAKPGFAVACREPFCISATSTRSTVSVAKPGFVVTFREPVCLQRHRLLYITIPTSVSPAIVPRRLFHSTFRLGHGDGVIKTAVLRRYHFPLFGTASTHHLSSSLSRIPNFGLSDTSRLSTIQPGLNFLLSLPAKDFSRDDGVYHGGGSKSSPEQDTTDEEHDGWTRDMTAFGSG